MKYRILISVILVCLLAGICFMKFGVTFTDAPSTTTPAPASEPAEDAQYRNFKIN